MAKNKGARILITLKCTECRNFGNMTQASTKNRKKVSYTTTKNRRNTPNRLEIKKFCPSCNLHTIQKEIK
uniref:Large ribosomal subunit protein bL33c n=1 Tax=Protohalopteris sp. TaxID=2843287 RepID=A0A8F0JXH9_9PHAE|nr:ribosomal protein L33 [Protohalopteris sp.]